MSTKLSMCVLNCDCVRHQFLSVEQIDKILKSSFSHLNRCFYQKEKVFMFECLVTMVNYFI